MSTRDQLPEYLLGELGAAARAAFDAALADDPELRAEVERLRAVVALLQRYEPAAPSSSSSSST